MKKFCLNRTGNEPILKIWDQLSWFTHSFNKYLLNACDIIFLKNSRNSTTKLLGLIKEFPTVAIDRNLHIKHH